MSGALCHGLCVGVRKHLISVNYRTNTWVNWSDFSVAYWGWLEEGSFRWSAPPLIQDARYGHHLWFGFRRLRDKCLGRLIQFLCGSLGVTRVRFLSMISSAAHPRWPLRLPSWIWFPSIRGQMPGSIDPIFLRLILGWLEEGSFRWSALPLIQNGRHLVDMSFKFALLPHFAKIDLQKCLGL
jgi:hypothetical protein